MIRRVFTRRLSLLSLAAVIGAMAASTVEAASSGTTGLIPRRITLPGRPSEEIPAGRVPFSPVLRAQQGGDDHVVLATSLTRPGQINPSIGGSAGDNDTVNCCITVRSGRLFTDPWGGFTDPDGTFYFGFMANFGTGSKNHRVLEMHNATLGDSERILQLGYSEYTGVGPNMALWVNDGGGAGSQQVQLAENVDYATDSGTTHFMVLKFDMSTSGPDTISVYLDPVGTVEPVTPSAQITTNEFFADRFARDHELRVR